MSYSRVKAVELVMKSRMPAVTSVPNWGGRADPVPPPSYIGVTVGKQASSHRAGEGGGLVFRDFLSCRAALLGVAPTQGSGTYNYTPF